VTAPERHARAWLLLDAALAVHVADEALTGFLDFYNPLIRQLRNRPGFWPMPTFTFWRMAFGIDCPATSAPLLLVASIMLINASAARRRHADAA
jgi:hypothetical protein